MEDAQIIELFFARSEDAISELDKKYGKLCHKLADNILASAQDAEECVNDAYLSTWNAIPPQRPESLPAFVGTLVRRCSITRYRANTAMKRNSHYDMCMEELETFLASPQQAMEEHYAARELAAAIERFLDTQSKENRVLFMRRYWCRQLCRDRQAPRHHRGQRPIAPDAYAQAAQDLSDRTGGAGMTPELFSDAMNEIGAKYVEEALTYKRPAQRSFWSKLAKRAAMVALVALLALSGFAAASPAARAAMIHWVETWTGSQVSYEYAGDAPTGELPFYAITALPDGYTLDEDMSYEDSGFRQLCYRSGDDLILFSYIYMQDDSFSYYDMGEDTEISEITVNGCKGKFFLASDESLWSTLEWIDEESNLHFSLDASGDEAVLRALAESVAVTEKTVDLSDDDEDENILTLDDIEGEKLPDEEAKP